MSNAHSPNPRLSMAQLPSWLQHPLTWVTGKPLPDQQPLFRWTPWTRALSGLLVTGLGVAFSALAVATGGWAWLLVVPGFVMTSGGLRALYLEIAHNAVHHDFTRSPAIDRFVTELFTTITLTNGHDVFRADHVTNHHGRNGTPADADFATLLEWGFVPGLDQSSLRRRAAWAALDPRLHAGYLGSRLRSSLVEGPLVRRFATLAFHGSLLFAAAATGHWVTLVVAWLAPLTWGFQVSSLLQMLSGEHRWGLDVQEPVERLRGLTFGRFLGDEYPAAGKLARMRWWARLLLLHVPARVMVLIGNDIGPAHDVHHRRAHFDWPNAAYARRDLIDAGKLPGATEVWGSLADLMTYTLEGMSRGWRSSGSSAD